ncbi:MAG TPA: hypothetical protein VGX28_10445 [Frankiaceae bacterium]|nr:hypothetical protein [Frankiaceae bacterium]
MKLRSLVPASLALACAIAMPSTAAPGVAMDGVRRTHSTYEGQVSDPAFSLESAIVGEASRADCSATSCDATPVRLTVPKGSAGGRFKAVVTMPPQLAVSIGVYDAKGSRVAYTDIPSGGWACCQSLPYSQLTVTIARLPAGSYTVVIFDRAGQGTFTVDLDYKANPPARERGKS